MIGRSPGQYVQPGDPHWSVTWLGPSAGPLAQHRPDRVLGIERVRLTASATSGTVRPVLIKQSTPWTKHIARQRRPKGARRLSPGPPTAPNLLTQSSRSPGPCGLRKPASVISLSARVITLQTVWGALGERSRRSRARRSGTGSYPAHRGRCHDWQRRVSTLLFASHGVVAERV